ncbi:cell division ATP-binding protein FtsE [Pseudobacteroides cellulosolvens]|uniref:Cell division ATP-binding protein FtsE n=1 Tax=Pseudobacteroides cellulosolvens ATCC 35603 = DSM 2933 TaxID=398512 RepID=A0A0L6JNL2_9FIRM|nr:cell division ATP-binding protein FtsE [Pseudobacteroides cellulosolvens]KNY27349.1 cell division ATP-binding protein FtsE [Pseudobacteroides cellulosolvens ATCC 35603 = DSM 2933]
MINFENVTKIYQNGTLALTNINLKINKGDFTFFIGQSGSGKSTLIKLILREEEATEGIVSVNGFNVSTMLRKEIPFFRRSIGVVFQDFRLLPGKTVYENVAFAMQVVEALPKEIRRRVPTVLGLVGLSNKAKAYPNQLSGGEQQRVALARALVNNPVLLVADEPTGNLDPETSWGIMNLLAEVNQMGTTVVVATHEKNIVDTMKKRVIALSKGEIIRDQEKGQYEDEDTNHQIYN